MYVLTGLVAVVMTLYLVLRDTWVQTLAARMAADYLSKGLHTTVRIGGFDFSFRNGLVLEEILMKDLHDTTLFSARKLGVKPLWISPGKHLIRLDRIYVADGQFQLLTHRG
ncbi:MAG: hypothetical protein V1733_08685, partial [bacterium]